jgi:hypothetical protein
MNSKARNTGRDSCARRKLDNAKFHEEQLLGMLLKAPERLIEAEILEPLDLTLPRCRIALKTMRDFAEVRSKFSADLLPDVICEVAERAKCPELEIAAWFEALHEQCASAANIADFAGKVKRESLDRRIADALRDGDARKVRDLVNEQDSIKTRIHKSAATSRFIRLSAMENRPPAVDWLIRGYLERDTTTQLFGDPGSGKSFIALDMALSIATGQDWRGHATNSRPVFYIAGEGLRGLERRKEAWFRHHGIEARDAPFWFSDGAIALSDPSQLAIAIADIDAVIAVAAVGPPSLIVIDTLARNFGNGDENSTKDMSAFVAALDSLRQRYRCCILLVHHSGHNDKSRARGAIALLGSLDAEYRIEKIGDDLVQMVSTKQKDNDHPPALVWTFSRYDLPWADDYGQPINSAVLIPNDTVPTAKPVKDEILRGQHKQAFDILQELYNCQRRNLADAGHDPKTARVSSADWYEAMKKIGGDSSNRSKLRNALVDRGFVFFEGNYVYISEQNTAAR